MVGYNFCGVGIFVLFYWLIFDVGGLCGKYKRDIGGPEYSFRGFGFLVFLFLVGYLSGVFG